MGCCFCGGRHEMCGPGSRRRRPADPVMRGVTRRRTPRRDVLGTPLHGHHTALRHTRMPLIHRCVCTPACVCPGLLSSTFTANLDIKPSRADIIVPDAVIRKGNFAWRGCLKQVRLSTQCVVEAGEAARSLAEFRVLVAVPCS